MIEFSFTELGLLIWATAATAYAFDYKHREFMARFVVNKILEDETVYNDMRKNYNTFREHNA